MYYFIVNPESKSGKGKKIWKEIEDYLDQKNIEYCAKLTQVPRDACEVAKWVVSQPDDDKIIVAIGGDGTISEVMEGLYPYERITFGYIPMGSGNDFARGAGISRKWKEALDGILNEDHRIQMHPGRLEFNDQVRYFGGSMGIGFDAVVCHCVSNMKFKKYLNKMGIGKIAYLLAALKYIFTTKCEPMTIRVDGTEIFRFKKMFFMCGLNAKYEGGGFMFTPHGRLEDDQLHLCVVDDLPPVKRILLLPKALKGEHVGAAGIHLIDCKKVEIISAGPKMVHCDGEVHGMAKKAVASLEEATIDLVY